MKNRRNINQRRLVDPWDFLGKKVRRRLDRGWPGLFRREILPYLPVQLLESMYCGRKFGRPGKELYTLLGVLLLQQIFDLSDTETADQLATSIQWQYALDLPSGLYDDEAYICERVIWEARDTLVSHDDDAAHTIFATLTDRLIAVFNVDCRKQRIDGTHINSDMAKLGRMRILFRAIRAFLRKLKKKHPRIFNRRIVQELIDRYLGKESGDGVFAHTKPSEGAKRLENLADDAALLVAEFMAHHTVKRLESFKLLERVLHEQCTVIFGDGIDEPPVVKVEPKPGKEISSGSVQNPSDPDATYSGHKGQGYTLQLAETYTEDANDGDIEASEPPKNGPISPPDLITHAELHPANEFEGKAMEPALGAMLERGNWPDECLADTAFGSDDNIEMAAGCLIDLVAPVPGDRQTETVKSESSPKSGTANENAGLECPNDAGLSPKSGTTSSAEIPREGSGEGPLGVDDFEISPRKGDVANAETTPPSIERCPAGHAPKKRERREDGGEEATFDGAICAGCPLASRCPTRRVKRSPRIKIDGRSRRRGKGNSKRGRHRSGRLSTMVLDRVYKVSGKSLRLASRRQYVQTESFKDRYRWRAGVEATMSRLKSQTGAARVSYRGFRKVRFAVLLKALGLNILRAARAVATASASESTFTSGSPSIISLDDVSFVLSVFGILILVHIPESDFAPRFRSPIPARRTAA